MEHTIARCNCGKPLTRGVTRCDACTAVARVKARTRYRVKHGIDVDAPVLARRPVSVGV
jgi:hypothetical protein